MTRLPYLARRFRHSLPLAFLLIILTGCLPEPFSAAPTGPSRSNNTWLLGIWETPLEGGATLRAVVAPMDSQRLLITLEIRDAQGKIERSATLNGWFSKVGDAPLLTAKPAPGSDVAQGFYIVGYQFLNPLTVRIREITPGEGARSASSFGLRKAIRRAFKSGTLFQGDDRLWKKTGEIFWNPVGDPTNSTFSPPRKVP